MTTAIVYVSSHHGNTKKLLDAVAENFPEVRLIDALKEKDADLSGYDRIGFASGIAYGKFYPQLLAYMTEKLPAGKPVFFVCTYGLRRGGYFDAVRQSAADKGCAVLGEYGCLGYDTYGPLRLIGGLAKGHPDAGELAAAAEFYRTL